MASVDRLPSGKWRARVRRQGHTVSRSFRLKTDADGWVRDQEDRIDFCFTHKCTFHRFISILFCVAVFIYYFRRAVFL